MSARIERCFLLVVLASVSPACASIPRAPDEGGPRWVRVDSEHLFLETDLGTTQAVKLAADLERWRLAMTAAVFPGAVEPRSRFRVIALRPGERTFLSRKIAGLYSNHSFIGPAMFIGPSPGDNDPIPVVKHELAHAVIDQNLPQAPQWLHEGMAAFLETTELDRRTGEVTWGARHGGLSFQLIEVQGLETLFLPQRWPADQVENLTYIASRVVRMLVRAYPRELACFLGRLRAFDDPMASFDLCFPSRPQWPARIAKDGWGWSPETGATRIKLPVVDSRVSPMPDADVHAALALVDFLLMGTTAEHDGQRLTLTAGCDGHLRRALTLDAGQPLAGVLATRRGRVDTETRRQRSAAAILEHADDWRAWAAHAMTPGISRDERRAAIAQAQRIEPERGEVLAEAAFDALLDAHWTEAEGFARRAALLSPSSIRPRALWFTALERLGNCDAARTVVNNAPALAAELPGVVRRLFAALDLDGPRCALP